jgi:Ca2+/Na+ antiporter
MIYLVVSSQDEEEDMVLIRVDKEKDDDFTSNSEASEIIENKAFDKSESDHYNSVEKSHFIMPEQSAFKNKSHMEIRQIKRKKLIESIENDNSFFGFIIKGLVKILSKPWEMLLNLLTPKSSEGIYLLIRFLVPSILIWNVSEIELFVLEKLIRRLNVSATYLGLTLTAWGNNAPDMFNIASAMSKGMVDLAMNAAIASEIHNILIGLGLPWLVYNIKFKKSLNFTSNNLYFVTLSFFCFFILTFIIGLKINQHRLDRKFATFLICVYAIFFTVISLVTFQFNKI